MRDSFIFYRSFFDASKALNQIQKAQLFDAICEFALNQNQTKMEPMVSAFFSLIKPQLEANNKRYENGKKGGRSKTKTKPNLNQDQTKPEPNVNVNVNVNDNYNVKKEINTKEKIKEILVSAHPNIPSFETNIDDWIEYRGVGTSKGKLTIQAATKQAKFLASHSFRDAILIIDRSIMNGWSGLFPLDPKSKIADKSGNQSNEIKKLHIAGE